MAASGDMTFILNAEEQQMVAGLKRAEEAARRSAGNIKASLSGGGGGGGVGGAVTGAAYGLQDFTSILMQGGERNLSRALGSVTNNVGQMTAAFGPWGIALGTAAGLALQLGVAMWEQSQGVDNASEKLKEYNKTTDEMATKLRRGIEFVQKLRDLEKQGTVKQVDEERNNVRNRREQINEEIRQRQQRINALVFDRAMAGNNAPYTEDEKKTLREERKKIDDLRDEAKRMGNREIALDQLAPAVKRREDEKKAAKELAEFKKQEQEKQFQRDRQAAAEDMQRFKERIDAIKQLEEQTRTPTEKFQAEKERLIGLMRSGEISPELAGRGMANALRMLPQTRNTQGAEVFGSSGAVSAVVRAEANAEKQKETWQLMKDFLAEAKKQSDLLDGIKANTANNEVVEIGG